MRRRLDFVLACVAILGAMAVMVVLLERVDSPQRTYALALRQDACLRALEAGLASWSSDFGSYPPSDANDPNGVPYCGAMKLCEALVGRDLIGFDPGSAFRADGKDKTATRPLYPGATNAGTLGARKALYIDMEKFKVHRLSEIYGPNMTGPFDGNLPVICDVFERNHKTGVRAGMPILYYRADPAGTVLDAGHPDSVTNVLKHQDNRALLALGASWGANARHPLFTDPPLFYTMARECEAAHRSRPSRLCKGLLISAGPDGLYGTPDDLWAFAR